MAKAMQGAGDFSSSAGGSSSGSKSGSMLLAVRKKLMQTERALADKAQEVEVLKQDARVAKTSELEREKAVLLSEVKRLMQATSSMARCIADANTSLASLPEQAAMSSQNKTLQVAHNAGSASFLFHRNHVYMRPKPPSSHPTAALTRPLSKSALTSRSTSKNVRQAPPPLHVLTSSTTIPSRCIFVTSCACIPAAFL